MKILVIRLSSIGDVLLTTPVVRCLKRQLDGAEIHFLTKPANADLLASNPNIDRIVTLTDDTEAMVRDLRNECYQLVVDLQNNRRSRRVRRALGCPMTVYNKENCHKFWYVITKHDVMSGRHVVQRYLAAVAQLGVVDDGGGLELFLRDDVTEQLSQYKFHNTRYVVIACGSQHRSKTIPPERVLWLAERLAQSGLHVVLVGDKRDKENIGRAVSAGPDALAENIHNMCGAASLLLSAAIVSRAAAAVCPDSAMMHIASAFGVPVFAVWGSTVPSFGFEAYRVRHVNYENNSLPCRPCSRAGCDRCRKRDFECMTGNDWERIATDVLRFVRSSDTNTD